VDLSQYYWYAGLFTTPLAALGLFVAPGRVRLVSIVLIAALCWYAAGQVEGLYLLIARLPGFDGIQGPINGWYISALALALLAGSGLAWITARGPRFGLHQPLLLLILLDLIFWNSILNRIAYEQLNADEVYRAPVAALRAEIAGLGDGPVRLHGPLLTRIGYLNQTLQVGAESTYGYNPLELSRYADYLSAAETNPRLINGLAATYFVQVTHPLGPVILTANPSALALATLPPNVIVVENEQDEITSLRTLDPSLATLVRGPIPDVRQTDSADHVTVVERKQDRLLVDYSAASPRVVRLAIPSYPGWHAVLNGTELPTVTLDHALLGIIVPPGQGTISVRFVSNWFLFGALTSGACAALACAGAIGVIAIRKSSI
jgi:hypothetical protein